jgi:hypothetical protein
MTTKEIAAVLALRVYNADVAPQNLSFVPNGWVELPNPVPITDGFAYGVFRNESTGEVVISYRGTDGVWGGFIGPDGPQNVGMGLGIAVSQAKQAAAVYAAVLEQYGADSLGFNISFTEGGESGRNFH